MGTQTYIRLFFLTMKAGIRYALVCGKHKAGFGAYLLVWCIDANYLHEQQVEG